MPGHPINERRAAEKEARRAADREALRAGRRSHADLARENHFLARAGDFVRRPDGRPILLAFGARSPIGLP